MFIPTFGISPLTGTVMAGCLCAIMVGAVSVWTSPMIPKLASNTTDNPLEHSLSNLEISWVSSLVVLGGCFGCWLFAFLGNKYGRKWPFFSLGIPPTVGCLLMAIFPRISVFFVARFLSGLTVAGAFTLMITLMSEISTKYNRAVIMTICGMSQSIGDLFSYCIGPWVTVTTFNVILITPSILFMIFVIIFCRESPYFYLINNKQDLATKSLKLYRKPEDNIEQEILEIKQQLKLEQEGNIFDAMRTRSFIKGFIMANSLILFQQFTGVNCILMYSQSIFELVSSNLQPALCSIIIGAMQLTSGALCPLLTSRFNKKPILTASCIGMIIAEVTLGIYCILDQNDYDVSNLRFLPVTALTMFIFSYNFGFGALCWVIAIELYPTRLKTFALSFTIFIYFVLGFLLAQYFNAIVAAIGIGALFCIFSGCCVAAIIFIQTVLIETRNKTLQEIQNILGR